MPCHLFSQDSFVASWDNLLKLNITIFSWERSCLLFTYLYRIFTQFFKQEQMVLQSVVLEFLLLEFLQVPHMMIFTHLKLCLDHIYHLLLLQLAISSKSKCFNGYMHNYKIIKIWGVVDDCWSYFITRIQL